MIVLRMMLLSLPGASCKTLLLFPDGLSEFQSGGIVNFELKELNRHRQQLQEDQCVKEK